MNKWKQMIKYSVSINQPQIITAEFNDNALYIGP